MQLKDVANLLATTIELDEEYIRHWVQKLELSQVYEKVTVNGRHKP